MSPVRKNTNGRILFVGSGPGDPALLTVRAREVLGAAELAFTDFLAQKGAQFLPLLGRLYPESGVAEQSQGKIK